MKILKNGLKTLYYKWQANGKERKEEKARKKKKQIRCHRNISIEKQE
ncbi:hypothetical protein JGZ52_00420 [Staphylococcus pseudintermedius]|nr:hypothetical protein [Staphylococcus pseudintermedius]MBJ8322720.1 hypothetical protein [Staphylococcus pseudintermedius]